MSNGPTDLGPWTPIRIWWEEGAPRLDWCYTKGIPFGESSFQDVVEQAFRYPGRLLLRHRTAVDHLTRLAADQPGLMPAGFIFHSSRCGSTLAMRLLASLPSVHAIVEPGPVDDVVRAPEHDPALSVETQHDWLRAMISALGHPESRRQLHYVIKLDAWSVLDLPLFREAFPDTPWVFLYREPVDVVRSQMLRRGYHTIPSTLPLDVLGLDGVDLEELGQEGYVAAVEGRMYQAALDATQDGSGLLVNYSELPDAVWGRVLPFFGIEVAPEDVSDMQDLAQWDAKQPLLPYSPVPLQRDLDESTLAHAAAAWMAAPYEGLERRRIARR